MEFMCLPQSERVRDNSVAAAALKPDDPQIEVEDENGKVDTINELPSRLNLTPDAHLTSFRPRLNNHCQLLLRGTVQCAAPLEHGVGNVWEHLPQSE